MPQPLSFKAFWVPIRYEASCTIISTLFVTLGEESRALIQQPQKDFCVSPSWQMIAKHWWNNNWYGSTELFGENPTPLLIILPQISYGLLSIKAGCSQQEVGDKS
jgi:hypothetical protein